MKHVLTRALVLEHPSVTVAYSQPVAMDSMNTVQLSYYLLHFSLGGVPAQIDAQLEQSDDLDNWYSLGSATTIETTGLKRPAAVTDIAAAYVRVKFTVTADTGSAIVKTIAYTSSR